MRNVILLMLFCCSANASIYSCVDDSGKKVLRSDPCEQNEKQKVTEKLITPSISIGEKRKFEHLPDVAKAIVGGQPILIPAPNSLFQATSPRMIQSAELSIIKEDRLLAVFGTATDVGNGEFLMERYGLVQATRNVEPYQIPLDRFAKYKDDTKAEAVAGMSAVDRAEIQRNINRTTDWIASDMGVKLQVGVPSVGSFVILNETPTSLTMVTKMTAPVQVAGGNQKSVEMVEGMSLMLVKSKVIWLQLYARSNSREDFDWVVMNIVKWTRAVGAANP
jgi:hypothetical protein